MTSNKSIGAMIERWYRRAGFLWKWSLILWIIETIFFQAFNGLHWKANSSAEIFVDNIIQSGLTIGCICFALCLFTLVELHIKVFTDIKDKIDKENNT